VRKKVTDPHQGLLDLVLENLELVMEFLSLPLFALLFVA